MKLTLSRGNITIPLVESAGFVVGPNVEGLDTPPVALSEVEPADIDGAFITNVRYKPREINIPVGVYADSAQRVRALTRQLASLTNPQVGQVTLKVEHDAEDAQQLVPAAASEGNISGWVGNAVSDLLQSGLARTPPIAVRVQLTEDGIVGLNGFLAATLVEPLSVIPGQQYRAAAWFRSITGTSVKRLLVRFFDAAGVEILAPPTPGIAPIQATEFASVSKSTTGNVYQELSLDVTAPWNAATANIELASGVGSGAGFIADDITFTGVNIAREISGYLSAPLAGPLLPGENLGWRRLNLQLRCPDPMFAAPAQFIQVPNLGADQVVVDNIGDAVAYPIWTVLIASGFPATVTLNGRETFKLSDTAGNFVINTDPRALSIIRTATQTPEWEILSADSVLFGLPPGRSGISSTNIGGGLTEATGTFQTRWLTAW